MARCGGAAMAMAFSFPSLKKVPCSTHRGGAHLTILLFPFRPPCPDTNLLQGSLPQVQTSGSVCRLCSFLSFDDADSSAHRSLRRPRFVTTVKASLQPPSLLLLFVDLTAGAPALQHRLPGTIENAIPSSTDTLSLRTDTGFSGKIVLSLSLSSLSLSRSHRTVLCASPMKHPPARILCCARKHVIILIIGLNHRASHRGPASDGDE